MEFTNAKGFLEGMGKEFPEPDQEDGSISEEAYQKAGLSMVVRCFGCSMSMALFPDTVVDEHGFVYCADCTSMAQERNPE